MGIVRMMLQPVTGSNLVGMFREKTFRNLLLEAADHTYTTGYESGFIVVRDMPGARLHYSEAVRGTGGTIPSIEFADIADYGSLEKTPDLYPVFFHHFHRSADGPLCPTSTKKGGYDLGCFAKLRTGRHVRSRPLCSIGKIGNDMSGELLLLQERTEESLAPALRAYVWSCLEQLLDYTYTTQDAADELTRTGLYRSAVVRFRIDERKERHIVFSREEQDVVRQFAFTPTLVE